MIIRYFQSIKMSPHTIWRHRGVRPYYLMSNSVGAIEPIVQTVQNHTYFVGILQLIMFA